MRSTQQLSITLPNDVVGVVKAKVAAGEYANESEVFRASLHALLDREQAMENWLQQEVAGAYDALQADPGRAVSINKLRARLAAERS